MSDQSNAAADGHGKLRLGGRYEIDELLGRGGMAEVRKGCDLRLGRTIAVKRLRADLASDPSFQARFRREAQSAASLNHPSIVSVYDTGEEVAGDGSTLTIPFIVMEYVEGRTLRDILRGGRKILPERALEITGGVLEALAYSHRAGIVHRDIKPANVMLTPAGDVKVMDFGIARAIADSSATMTQTAAVLGTAQYLSPEQARGEQVDARSDLYSTGCLLYELLTGRPPFVGDSPVSVAYQHVREEPAPPSSLDPDIPPEIDAITLKALAKEPDARYQSAAEMRSDIERALAGQTVDASAAPPAVATSALLPPPPTTDPLAGTTATVPAAIDEEPKQRRRTWGFVLLAAAVVAAIALAGFVGWQLLKGDSPRRPVSVPSLVGLTQERAESKLAKEHLKPSVTYDTSDTVDKGHVISQDPGPGDFVRRGGTVALVVSAGKKLVPVPPVEDGNRAQAQAALEDSKLRWRFVAEASDETKNQVTRTDPAPGTQVPQGSLVTVYYSQGLPTVPKVVGLSQQQAEAALRADGFKPVVSLDATSDQPAGTVISQDPRAGAKRAAGTPVVITVSAAPETPPSTPTPTPTQTPTPTPSQSATSTTTNSEPPHGPPTGHGPPTTPPGQQ